jgi:hypothetical protein
VAGAIPEKLAQRALVPLALAFSLGQEGCSAHARSTATGGSGGTNVVPVYVWDAGSCSQACLTP